MYNLQKATHDSVTVIGLNPGVSVFCCEFGPSVCHVCFVCHCLVLCTEQVTVGIKMGPSYANLFVSFITIFQQI